MLGSDSKDLKKRTISDKISKDRTYEIARNRKRYISKSTSKLLASLIFKLFDEKKRLGAIVTSKAGVYVNEQLAEELHKPVFKK